MRYKPSEYGLWDNFITIMALNENRVTRSDLIKAFGKRAEYSIEKLRRKNIIKTKMGVRPHALFLTTPKGINYAREKEIPNEIRELVYKKKNNWDEATMIRISRKSQIITDMFLNDITISDKLELDNKPLFIPSVYFKQELSAYDNILGISCKGIITNTNMYYGLYSMLNGNQKLSPNTEALTITEINKRLSPYEQIANSKIVFDEGLEGLRKIIKNSKSHERKKTIDSYIRPTRHTYESAYHSTFYVPIGERGKKHIEALLYKRESIRKELIESNNLEEGVNIFFPYDTGTLQLMTKTKTVTKVYVPSEDKEEIEEIINNPNVLLQPINI